ncbi:hypothetical protein [Frankia sp. AvcI1]|uniref:hypothetical protein n=1 Tax=Frankia sp. AvcI1 TaxID=573496 RepID=UPI0021182831|nr:hypothetical protein [Frankia sp. AvcI1]
MHGGAADRGGDHPPDEPPRAGRPPARIEAGWAVKGKLPGTFADYAVLRCSSVYFGRGDYGAILRRFTPGTPPPPEAAGRPDTGGLPWVTVSYAPRPGGGLLGVARCDWTAEVDGAGRRIARTTYLCAPFDELAAAQVTYEDLHSALRLDPAVAAVLRPEADAATDAEAGAPARLGHLPGLDPAVVAQYLADEDRFRFAAGVAGLVLCGPVALLGAPALPPEQRVAERLRLLDAVAALLPFGQRAQLVASTWVRSGADHRIRLAFSDQAWPGAVAARVPVGGHPGELPALPDVAAEYQRLLIGLRDRYGEPVERIVAHLTEPAYQGAHPIADPRHALLSLADLPGPAFFATLVPVLTRARRAHAGAAAGTEDQQARRRAALRSAEDTSALLRAQRLRGKLAGLDTREQDDAVRAALAHHHGAPYVSLELARLAVADDQRAAGARPAGAAARNGGPGLDGGQAAAHSVGWLAWLVREPALAQAVRPFVEVLSNRPDGQVFAAAGSEAGLPLLADHRYLLALSRLARLVGVGEPLRVPMTRWLLEQAAARSLAAPVAAAWAGELRASAGQGTGGAPGANRPGGQLAAVALADAVALLLDGRPVRPIAARMTVPDYGVALHRTVMGLTRRFASDMGVRLLHELGRSLDAEGWPADLAVADRTLRLLESLVRDTGHMLPDSLRVAVRTYLLGRPKLPSETARAWRDMIEGYLPRQ